jgi:hypothetical protein
MQRLCAGKVSVTQIDAGIWEHRTFRLARDRHEQPELMVSEPEG